MEKRHECRTWRHGLHRNARFIDRIRNKQPAPMDCYDAAWSAITALSEMSVARRSFGGLPRLLRVVNGSIAKPSFCIGYVMNKQTLGKVARVPHSSFFVNIVSMLGSNNHYSVISSPCRRGISPGCLWRSALFVRIWAKAQTEDHRCRLSKALKAEIRVGIAK